MPVQYPALPDWLGGSITVAGFTLPVYKDVFLVATTIVVLGLVWLLINKTDLGMIIRAGTRRRGDGDDPRHQHVGDVHVRIRHRLVYGGTCGRARGARLRNHPEPRIAVDRAGRSSSLSSAASARFGAPSSAALIIGILSSLMELIYPPAVELTGFFIMGVILLVRPRGLFGVEGLFE